MARNKKSGIPVSSFRVWIVVLAVVLGTTLGGGFFTFFYGRGLSYMSNDSAVCANCHIMGDHYDRWTNSSHRNVANCNDCHLPHTFPGKFITKAENGFNHSAAFTTGKFVEPIRITPKNRKITEDACRYCHKDMVHPIDAHDGQQDMSCIRCHSDVGHK